MTQTARSSAEMGQLEMIVDDGFWSVLAHSILNSVATIRLGVDTLEHAASPVGSTGRTVLQRDLRLELSRLEELVSYLALFPVP